MNAAEYKKLLARYGLTQVEMAELLGVSLRTSNGWAGGKPIPAPVVKLIKLMIETGRLKVK